MYYHFFLHFSSPSPFSFFAVVPITIALDWGEKKRWTSSTSNI